MFGCKCKFLYQRSKWTMSKIGNVSSRFFSTRPSLIIEFFSPQGASTTCKGAQRYKKQDRGCFNLRVVFEFLHFNPPYLLPETDLWYFVNMGVHTAQSVIRSNVRDMWPFWQLIRVIRRLDLTNKKTKDIRRQNFEKSVALTDDQVHEFFSY